MYKCIFRYQWYLRWLRPFLPTHQLLRNEEWADERGLAISAPKSTITLFTPLFAQSNTHPRVTLNFPLIPWKDSLYTGSDLWPSLQFQCPCQIYNHPGLTPYQHPQGPCWYRLGSTKENHTYPLHVPYPVPFQVCSSQHLTISYSANPNYPKLCPPHSHWLH